MAEHCSDPLPIIPPKRFDRTYAPAALMQNPISCQINRCVHWRSSAKPHDQHVPFPSTIKTNLYKIQLNSMAQKYAVRLLQVSRPLKIRQAQPQQCVIITHNRKAILLAIIPSFAD
jgi:hypothetical protein